MEQKTNNQQTLPPKTIGIIGGGQLGRMMAHEATAMGYKVIVLDPTEDCPTAQVAHDQIVAAYDDMDAIKQLTKACDIVTYEFENVDVEAATYIEKKGKLPQGAEALRITQHRAREKELLQKLQLPVAPCAVVETAEQCKEAIETIALPAVVKTCRGSYDGKGQLKIDTEEDISDAMEFVEKAYPCIVEQWMPFTKEVSVVFTRGLNGDITFFPLAENVHMHQILHTTIAPAQVDETIEKKALHAAKRIAEEMNIIGTFAIEMFVVENEIYINEMAPRPHNSGHYTIEACNISQFGQHIRAICGLPLIPVVQHQPACMVNILGEHMERALDTLATDDKSFVHLYGKAEVKVKRKMGHITWVGKDLDELLKNSIPFEEDLK